MRPVFATIILIIGFSANLVAKDILSYLTPKPKQINISKIESSFSKETILELKNLLPILHKDFFDNDNAIKAISDKISFDIDEDLYEPQHYKLSIDKNCINIIGSDGAALFYAKQTLTQILDYVLSENVKLMCMTIDDFPDFERRGYMLDISRDKVPTMHTLFSIIDKLSEWKINEFQLYTEHTFAYQNHEVVWEYSSPITAKEIKTLNEYCKQRYIDLVPNQNSFGHFENWLKHDEYLYLAECPEDCSTKWGNRKRTSLSPANPQSLELMSELYEELLPNFSSKYFNIGCDETVELGKGLSKKLCDSLGLGNVYLNYLKELNKKVNNFGKQTLFWGDIILNHKDLIFDIPCNMTALVWGYDKDYDFNKNLKDFYLSGIDYYVCPGTSTWRSLIGRNPISFENMKNAATYGKKYYAKGFLLTDWGDYGHWQPLSVSYPAMLEGASFSWNYDSTSLQNLEFQLNHYIFNDSSEKTAKALLKLGSAYQKAEIPDGVANAFHLMLHRYRWTMNGNYQTKNLKIDKLKGAEREILEALDILKTATPHCEDASLIKEELALASEIAIHGIHLGIARLNAKDAETKNIPSEIKAELANELLPLIERQKILWTERNRIGGLNESLQKLEDICNYYTE